MNTEKELKNIIEIEGSRILGSLSEKDRDGMKAYIFLQCLESKDNDDFKVKMYSALAFSIFLGLAIILSSYIFSHVYSLYVNTNFEHLQEVRKFRHKVETLEKRCIEQVLCECKN